MKVSLITRHAISNYGSLLQTIATQTVIQKLGYECEVTDYIRDDENYKNTAKLLLKKNEKWNSSLVKRLIYLAVQSPEYYISGKKFEKMRRRVLNLSKKYVSLKQLCDNPPKADIYITGSDQVWGPVGENDFDAAYFLSYVPNGKKAVSYAASFGKTKFTDDILNEYKNMLAKYSAVTVRENSAQSILIDMGIKNAKQVIDPTLLITAQEWEKMITKKISGKYVLIYQLHSNPEMDAYAKKFSEKAGLPLIRITPTFHQIIRGGKTVLLPDAGEFLAYIKNAEYMITDSFHGTAFAINFNTQFVEILPGETATRNQSILELTGLKNRILCSYDDFSFIDKKTDYTPVNSIIEAARNESLQTLKKILGND